MQPVRRKRAEEKARTESGDSRESGGGNGDINRLNGEKRAREMIPPKMQSKPDQLKAFKIKSRQGAQPNNAYSFEILSRDH